MLGRDFSCAFGPFFRKNGSGHFVRNYSVRVPVAEHMRAMNLFLFKVFGSTKPANVSRINASAKSISATMRGLRGSCWRRAMRFFANHPVHAAQFSSAFRVTQASVPGSESSKRPDKAIIAVISQHYFLIEALRMTVRPVSFLAVPFQQ